MNLLRYWLSWWKRVGFYATIAICALSSFVLLTRLHHSACLTGLDDANSRYFGHREQLRQQQEQLVKLRQQEKQLRTQLQQQETELEKLKTQLASPARTLPVNPEHLPREAEKPSEHPEERKQERIDRIYYINLDKNVKRREMMEAQLSKLTIPWQRVSASKGETNSTACVESNRLPEGNCIGVSGLAKSNLDIINNYNTTGLTLVFEDDIKIEDLENLQDTVDRAIQSVPSDWDIIRWDCNMGVPPWMDYVNKEKTVFRTHFERPCKPNKRWSECKYCGGTFAMLWRGSSVHKLREIWSSLPYSDIDCRLTTPKLKSYCVRKVKEYKFMHSTERFFTHDPPVGERTDIPQDHYVRFWPELANATVAANPTNTTETLGKGDESIQHENQQPQQEVFQHRVDRIYYINLDKNIKRRESMEAQLNQLTVPWQRVSASVGETNSSACIESNRLPEGNCLGVSGLAKSNLNIIDHYNTTGLTLVFEDDIKINDLEKLQETVDRTIQMVPSDWDIIRWDCNMDVPPWMDFVNEEETVFRTLFTRKCKPKGRWSSCDYCGGTFAMLWRGSSVNKLREVWSGLPYSDIDCRLTTPKLNSYCVRKVNPRRFTNKKHERFFVHAPPTGERSDIPQEQYVKFWPELQNGTDNETNQIVA